MPIIYTPRGRAREYAPFAANIYRGCTCGCVYCFVRSIPGNRELSMLEATPRANIVEKIRKDAEKMRGCKDLILLCFTCDPYPDIPEVGITSEILDILAENDLNVTVLTKRAVTPIRDFPLLAKQGWWYGATMTGLHGKVEQLDYEPLAATWHQRMMTLKFAKAKNIRTWVSLEPALSLSGSLELVDGMADTIDHWKIGKLNHSKDLPHELQVIAEEMDWARYLKDVEGELVGRGFKEIEEPGVLEPGTYYIKNDLRKYRS